MAQTSPIAKISWPEWMVVCVLACMQADDAMAKGNAQDAERDGALIGCHTMGEYAEALLRYRLAFLQRVAPQPSDG
jgi:hypothetical protein